MESGTCPNDLRIRRQACVSRMKRGAPRSALSAVNVWASSPPIIRSSTIRRDRLGPVRIGRGAPARGPSCPRPLTRPHQHGTTHRLSLDTTWGTDENTAVAIPSKREQRLTRCGPAEGVSTTSSRGGPKSKFLSSHLDGAELGEALRDELDVGLEVLERSGGRTPWAPLRPPAPHRSGLQQVAASDSTSKSHKLPIRPEMRGMIRHRQMGVKVASPGGGAVTRGRRRSGLLFGWEPPCGSLL